MLLSSAPASAIVCTKTEGPPGDEITVTLDIQDPADGALIPATAACGQELTISGAWAIVAPPPLYDFYIVIDASGSTATDSGSDVDRDGIRFEYDDNIYCAEIQAARDFVAALDPATSRVSVTRFQSFAELAQPLTADLAAADTALANMKLRVPGGGTAYVPAMRSMEAEVVASGDRVNRNQVCLFLSDGQPNESLAAVHAEALNVAALPVMMHTFALGFATSAALEDMALTTGGIFTPLVNPGDIVALLPSFIPDRPRRLDSFNDVDGAAGTGDADGATDRFTATVTIYPGTNRITLTLTSTGIPQVSVDCTITVNVPKGFIAVAGPLQTVCEGVPFRLDASASNVANCAAPIYRWVDCGGADVCPPSSSPFCDVVACAGCRGFNLEISCAGELCTTTSFTPVECFATPRNAPAATPGCGLTVDLTCGESTGLTNWWDLDSAVDADGDGDFENDLDRPGCDIPVTFPAAGSYNVTANVLDDATGCSAKTLLRLEVFGGPTPKNIDGGLCPSIIAAFSCGTADPASTYWWDFDGMTDSDGDGNPTNDADANGCDTSTSWPVDGTHVVSGWQLDANGCEWLIQQGTLIVAGGAIPGETPDLRVSRSVDAVTMSWGSVPGAPSHRVLRGTIDSLWTLRLYDHAADDSFSQGTCDTAGALSFTDPDDAADDIGYYYLITAINPCGGEGPTGFGWDGTQATTRPARLVTGSCP